MSAKPAPVLADIELSARILRTLGAGQDAVWDLLATHVAVAELIEADREYDAAREAWERVQASEMLPASVKAERATRLAAAGVRRRAALARCEGGRA